MFIAALFLRNQKLEIISTGEWIKKIWEMCKSQCTQWSIIQPLERMKPRPLGVHFKDEWEMRMLYSCIDNRAPHVLLRTAVTPVTESNTEQTEHLMCRSCWESSAPSHPLGAHPALEDSFYDCTVVESKRRDRGRSSSSPVTQSSGSQFALGVTSGNRL